jgi:hypothetical protein
METSLHEHIGAGCSDQPRPVVVAEPVPEHISALQGSRDGVRTWTITPDLHQVHLLLCSLCWDLFIRSKSNVWGRYLR